MADIYSRRKRSRIMAAIRSADTKPEGRLYAVVRNALGPRCRIERNVRMLPGQPDIFVPSLRVAIFMDGCFYHCCPRHGHIPKSNRAYWAPKLAANARRDLANRRKLRRMGYAAWRVWEHAVRGPALPRTERGLAWRLAFRRTVLGGRRTFPTLRSV